MPKWRLLIHEANDAATNMAIDEALLRTGKPTLRFYSWKPSAVSIGYFQGITEEVNLNEFKLIENYRDKRFKSYDCFIIHPGEFEWYDLTRIDELRELFDLSYWKR